MVSQVLHDVGVSVAMGAWQHRSIGATPLGGDDVWKSPTQFQFHVSSAGQERRVLTSISHVVVEYEVLYLVCFEQRSLLCDFLCFSDEAAIFSLVGVSVLLLLLLVVTFSLPV